MRFENSAARYTRSVLGVFALLLALWTPQTADAQVLYGSITGHVRDASGAAIPGATVTVTNVRTGLVRETTTDTTGNYDVPTVPTGRYNVSVKASGFKSVTRENVEVTINTTARVDLSVQVGEVAETVIITAEATQLKTDRAEVSSELTNKPLQNLPVPLGRNYQNLFKTLPGFTPPADAHSVPSNPSRSLVFNVNGASRSSNNTRIDGVSTTNIWLPHVTAYIPALESIEVVNVATNSFDAEQGLAGGAAINVQIKSGTNEFHGSAFEYHANQHLKARDYFRPANQPKGKFIQNQYGGTIGGPIIRNKLFFFASYEGTKNRQNDSLIQSVPTMAIRNGDFRGLTYANGQPIIIYDPLTGNLDGTGRTQISCNGVANVICQDRIHPIIKKILPLIPAPNLPGEQNNFFVGAPFSFDRWTLDSKINYNITSKLNMYGRYSVLDFFTVNETIFGKALQGRAINSSNPGTGSGKTHNFSVGGVYTITPNLIFDANFGFVRMNAGVAQSDIGENRGLDFLGIPGTNGPNDFEGGFPLFDVTTYSDYGTTDTFMPYTRSDDQYQIVANVNWLRGAHNIRVGMDVYRQKMNHIQPEFLGGGSLGARGGFVFTNDVTRLNGGGAGTQYHGWASFLLGLPNRVGKLELDVAPYTTRNWQYSFYARDQWQVNQKLTFSYGTRWEYFPVPRRADRGFERYNVNTNMMEIGCIGSVPCDLGVEVSKALFAPRVGLAYRITPSFVVRAGYGLTNDPYALARPLRTNHPVLLNLNVQAPNNFQFASRLEQGIPIVPPVSLGNGIITIPGNVAAVTLPDKFDRGYVQSWNLSLQKEIGWGFVGEAAYVATRQVRQLGLIELNWAPIGTGNNGRQLRQRFGRDASTQLIAPVGGSSYHGLQTRLDRRFSDFYELKMNYTFSKAMNDNGQPDSDNGRRINIPQFYHLDKAVSNFDRRHNFQLTNILELPFGRGRRYLAGTNRAVSTVVSGWQVNNIVSWYSGVPFSVTADGGALNAPGSAQRADIVKSSVTINSDRRGPGQKYFDTTAFAQPVGARFGTAAWNILRGPVVFQWDFGLFRQFQITEKVNLQFRAESFNFTNTPQWGNPNGNVNANNFGEISGVAATERQYRFALRLGF